MAIAPKTAKLSSKPPTVAASLAASLADWKSQYGRSRAGAPEDCPCPAAKGSNRC